MSGGALVTVGGFELEIRPGTEDDVPILLTFIRSMAAFERLPVSATEESLRSALFGERPESRTLLAFVGGTPVAYVIYFFTFATMTGRRGLWLDDLFVAEGYRGKGIGQALMEYLADIAVQNECARFEWMVLDWNEAAIRFYERLGASFVTGWRMCRLEGAQLSELAASQTHHP